MVYLDPRSNVDENRLMLLTGRPGPNAFYSDMYGIQLSNNTP